MPKNNLLVLYLSKGACDQTSSWNWCQRTIIIDRIRSKCRKRKDLELAPPWDIYVHWKYLCWGSPIITRKGWTTEYSAPGITRRMRSGPRPPLPPNFLSVWLSGYPDTSGLRPLPPFLRGSWVVCRSGYAGGVRVTQKIRGEGWSNSTAYPPFSRGV